MAEVTYSTIQFNTNTNTIQYKEYKRLR